MASMGLLRRLPRPRPCAGGSGIRLQRTIWSAPDPNHREHWQQQAGMIRSGTQQSMLAVLEERGLVKDVAGGREALNWLLTEKPIGAYVGVDPTAPSLHVGHLLPLMALYWMYLYGFPTVALLGGGTVLIGDPSGRTTARARQTSEIQRMNSKSMQRQLQQLWTHVKELGIRHQHPAEIGRNRSTLNNKDWLHDLSAIDLMRTMGSGMRLGAMLSRDSVRTRMESGDGMALSEFCYPLFQGYDWWHMYKKHGVQLQLGGSDQYGNICAGMDAVEIMRKSHEEKPTGQDDSLSATFGLTTPLLTTASGEKFGKSAGNAVWLDPDMLSSFDLYQYLLSTSDDDVERYLKLFTFLPMESISLVMGAQRQDASKRIAQHLLAKEVVALAHGSLAAKEAELAHKHAFGHGANTYHLGLVRSVLATKERKGGEGQGNKEQAQELQMKLYKQQVASNAGTTTSTSVTEGASKTSSSPDLVTVPLALLQKGTFPQLLYAAGLVSSKSEGHRLIKSKGAYVVLPNSGTVEEPFYLKWDPIPEGADPNNYLVDYKALVLRSGKSKIRICRVMGTNEFEEDGLSCPGWEEFKMKRAEEISDRK